VGTSDQNGNLLMDVKVSGASAPGGFVYFDTNGNKGGSLSGDTIMGRVYRNGPGPVGYINSGYGLVTDFATDPPAAVPEPSTILFVGAALASIAVVTIRRTIHN
jgi:hypothetical protein